jgi:hypothetical protein
MFQNLSKRNIFRSRLWEKEWFLVLDVIQKLRRSKAPISPMTLGWNPETGVKRRSKKLVTDTGEEKSHHRVAGYGKGECMSRPKAIGASLSHLPFLNAEPEKRRISVHCNQRGKQLLKILF